jgi:hypothetical protein
MVLYSITLSINVKQPLLELFNMLFVSIKHIASCRCAFAPDIILSIGRKNFIYTVTP